MAAFQSFLILHINISLPSVQTFHIIFQTAVRAIKSRYKIIEIYHRNANFRVDCKEHIFCYLTW